VLVEEEEVPQRTPISGPIGLSPLDITPIVWEYPSKGICMLNLLGGVSTSLATMFQAGIPVRKYLYVEKNQTAKKVSSRHLCHNPSCCNCNLGLAFKARVSKVAGQEGNSRSMPHAPKSARECEGIDPHTPKGTPILGVGIPMNSQMFKERF